MLAGMAGIAAGALLTRGAKAGPLNPPAGPVTSTGKTLTEVEPRIAVNQTNTPGDATATHRITQPGSYYLTGNIVGSINRSGIFIDAAGVTLDLNGFALIGATGSNSGVLGSGSASRCTVFNGSIVGWGNLGVTLNIDARLRDLTIRQCLLGGITCSSGAIIERCIVRGNTGFGINTGFGAVIRGCAVLESNGNGINTSTSCSITDTVVTGNSGIGINTNASTVSRCTVTFQTGSGVGIRVTSRSMVERCTVAQNSGVGIEVIGASNSIVENNVAANSGIGIRVTPEQSRCLIDGNHLAVNSGGGLSLIGGGGIAIRNRARDNTGFNYSIGFGNDVGPIGTAASSTSPWANLQF